MTVYYKIDGSNCYYTNEQKSDYDTWTISDFPADGNNVIIELYNNKFELPPNSTGLFKGCTNSTFNTSKWDTSKVTRFDEMFKYSHITNIDLSNCDTSSFYESAESMFEQCSDLVAIKPPVFNCTNPDRNYNFRNMFYNCSSLQELDLSNWNMKYAWHIYQMFAGCISLKKLNLIGWKFTKGHITFAGGVFNGCSKLECIYVEDGTNWKTYGVDPVYSSGMFTGCDRLPNFTSSATNVERANTVKNSGYFTSGHLWKYTNVFLKEENNWKSVTVFEKDSNSWQWRDVKI